LTRPPTAGYDPETVGNRLAITSILVTLAIVSGCNDGRTSVLVDVSSAAPLASLSATVSVAGQAITEMLPKDGGAPTLPGRFVVLLADEALDVGVSLEGTDAAGGAVSASGTVRSVPHEQVTLPLVIGSGADGGEPADGAVDMSGVDGGGTVIASDNFMRANQTEWGKASDSQVWMGDAASDTGFLVAAMNGIITSSSTAQVTGWLGPQATNVDVKLTVMFGSTTGSSVGPAARIQDTGDLYAALLASNGGVRIVKVVGGTQSPLATGASISVSAGIAYSVRLQAIGTQLQARFWPAAQAEPKTWSIVVVDNTFASGFAGVRAAVASSLVRVTEFQATTLP
jgi:hypothetical protein